MSRLMMNLQKTAIAGNELSFMYPAMVTIYNNLLAERNDEEALEGGASDILYAWCSMAYAARQPIFSEDGPMTCLFSHPEEYGNDL